MEAGFPLKASCRAGSTEGRSRADLGIQGRKHSLPLTQQQGWHPWRAATSDTAVISQQSSSSPPSVLPEPGKCWKGWR